MSNPSRLLALAGLLLCSLGSTPPAFADQVDPSGRVARLNHTQGEVSYSPAGEEDWFDAMRNRPLSRGDRLWTERDARAELQVGSAAFRLGPGTSFEFLELNDRFAQVQVTQGTINVRVRRLYPGQTYEVATPNLAFSIDRIGRYRIDVDPRDGETTVVVSEGAGQAYGENSRFALRTGDTVRFHGTDLRDYEMYGLPRADSFDGYVRERDRRLDSSASLRYVSDDVVGYADLDEYGSWRAVPNYGNAWFPSRVDADWAPYRDGRWVWQDPWGWTWVDEAPWGFAPSHYGRWVNVENRWGWIPGPRNTRPVYAPALVAFVGGSGFGVALSGGGVSIGWFPLGPREVYVPSYRASRDYFTRVNVNNTVVNNTVITNVYNDYSGGNVNVTQVTYANRAVAGAVTAVPSAAFVSAKPVRQAAIQLDRNAASGGQITRIAPIAPSAQSVTGAAAASNARPSKEATQRRVVARTAPPPAERPFAAREQQLQKSPGQPMEVPAAVSAPAPNSNAAQVNVIGAQANAVDARAAGSRRGGGKPAGAPGQMKPLERGAANAPPPGDRGPGDKRDARDAAAKPAEAPVDAQNAQAKEQAQRERKAEGDKQQADAQQQAQRERKAEGDKQQAEAQQQTQRERKAESDKQQAEAQQQTQRERKAEGDKQQADAQQQAQRERKAQGDKQAAEAQQQAQRGHKAEIDKQAAAQQAEAQQQADRRQQEETQQQGQRVRKENSDRQPTAPQQADSKGQAEAQRERKADSDKQAAAQQQAERQSQAETQQNAQRQRKADSDKQAAEQQQAEQKRQADVQPQERRQPKAEQAAAAPPRQPEPQQQQAKQPQQQQQQKQQDAAPTEQQQPAKGKAKEKAKGKKGDKDEPQDPNAPNDPDTDKHEG